MSGEAEGNTLAINLCILFSDDINKYCKYFLDEEQYHSGYKRAVKRTHNFMTLVVETSQPRSTSQ